MLPFISAELLFSGNALQLVLKWARIKKLWCWVKMKRIMEWIKPNPRILSFQQLESPKKYRTSETTRRVSLVQLYPNSKLGPAPQPPNVHLTRKSRPFSLQENGWSHLPVLRSRHSSTTSM